MTRSDRPTPWICFAGQDWWYHNRAHSDFQLMRRIARTRPVLVVNSIGLRMPTPGTSTHVVRRVLRKLRSTARAVRRPLPDTPDFVVMTPVVLPLYQYPTARRINAHLVRAQVRAVAAWLRFRHPVITVTLPTAVDVVAPMSRSALLYNRSDRLSEYPESDTATIAGLEDDLMAVADRVLYVSHALMAEDSAQVGDRAVFLDHGVDLERFRPRLAEHPDLAAIAHPRIGFFGGIDDYVVDVDLLERVAREIPEAQLVLVGDATCPMDRFAELPNVHVLGFRPYEQIPALGTGFDVALMPWVDNEWIRMCNPIKLKEYLALGLPVVTTYYPEIDHCTADVAVAGDADEFVALVRKEIEQGPSTERDRERRRGMVADSSWEARADVLLTVADDARPDGR